MATDACVLLVPGLNNSGPDHWQSYWEWGRDDTARVEQDNWHDPAPDAWCAAIEAAIAAAGRRVVVAAHSLGCIAFAHWAARADTTRIAGAMLVAPCDPERIGAPPAITRFAPAPRAALPFKTIVVASPNDPFVTAERARCFAEHWGASLVETEPLGHINATSRLGAWPFGQALLDDLIATEASGGYARAAALRDAAPWPCGGATADASR